MDNQHNILQYIRRVAPRLIRSRPFDHLRPLTRQDYLTNYRGVQATLRPIVQEGRSFLRNVTGSTTANLLSVAKALCDSDPYLSYPTELITALTAIQRLGADGKTTRIINRPVYILESFNGLTADTMAEAARNFATAAELVRLDLGDLPQTGVWMGTLQVAGAWAVWVYRGVAEGTATLQVYDEHNEWSDHEVKLAFIDPVAQLLSGTEIERTEAAEVVGMSQVKLFEHASLESSGPLSVRIIQALIHSPDPILTSKRLLIDDPIASFDEIVLALRDLHFRCVLDATNMGTEVFDYVRSNVV
ncbi:hypothetical protein BCR39DRAFT_53869 [Naematelia encephala]|uniref:Uncharacterized protein n=1 Tax=Naematelia encephala TaxID=71784 RepID=A0A1Y2AGD9_9TREE|nr:hypothetical protein BCR39DRAFT_53869 [Naematelia encephala]